MTGQTVEEVVIQLTKDFTEEWGIDDLEISKETLLKGDIGFDSSDTMQLFAAIVEYYKGVDFRFQDLVMQNDRYVDDLRIGQIIVFVLKRLSAATDKGSK